MSVDDDRISVRALPADTVVKAVKAMRNQPDGMTTAQWLVLVEAGILPAGAENAFVEFSEGPESQSWTVQARWIEFPDD